MLQKLKASRLFRVVSVYTVASWVLLQLGDIVIEPLGMPPEAQTYLIFALMAGLPLALLSGFLLDKTPDANEAPPSQATGESSTAIAKVAVLPFTSRLEIDSKNLFGRTLAEAITHEITVNSEIPVISSVSAERFAGETPDLQAARTTLGISHAIVGSVAASDGKFKIEVQLIEVGAETTLWSECISCAVNDPLAAEVRVAKSSLARLVGKPMPKSIEPRRMDPIAYQQYLLAMDDYQKSNFPACRDHAEHSIKLQPDNILAENLLAQLYLTWAVYGFAVVKDPLTQSRRHLKTAQTIDPDFPAARQIEAQLAVYVERDFEQAVNLAAACTQSRTVLSDSIATLFLYGFRYDDAVRLQRRLVEKDPLNLRMLIKLQRYERFCGDIDEADRIHAFCRDVNRQHPMVLQDVIEIAIQKGDLDRAERYLYGDQDKSNRWWAPQVSHMWLGSRLEMQLGRETEARRLAAMLAERSDVLPTLKAEAYFNVDDLDAALMWANVAVDEYDPGAYQLPHPFAVRSSNDPVMVRFREDPRYPALLQRLGIDQQSLSDVKWFNADDVML